MKLFDAIITIKTAIETSMAAKDNLAWKAAVDSAGLVSQGDRGVTGLDESYVATFGPLELRLRHTWRDTSKPHDIRPDRTRLILELLHDGKPIDSFTNGYEV